MESPRYWAFIAYSHRDKRWAAWLHRRLELYRVPRSLVGRPDADGQPTPRKLVPIFRDRDELPGSPDLGASIRDALSASRNLVVIASPDAAASRWVDAEVRWFQDSGRARRVLCFMVAGEPNSDPSSGLLECLPPAMRSDRSVGSELLAADARPGNPDRRRAPLVLLAAILGVGLDTLVARERQRARRRLAVAAALVAGVVGMGWGVAAWRTQVRVMQAERRVEDAAANAKKLLAFAEQRSREKLQREKRASRAAALERMAYDSLLRQQYDTVVGHLAEAAELDPPGPTRELMMGWALARAPKHSKIYFGTELQGYRSDFIASAAFSGDGGLIAAADERGRAFLHDGQTGKRLRELAHPDGAMFRDLSFGAGGKTVFATAQFGPARAWHVTSGLTAAGFPVPAGPQIVIGELNLLAVSGAEDRVVSAAEQGGAAVLWNAAGTQKLATVESKGVSLRTIAFAPNGERWAIADATGEVSVYAAKDGARLGSFTSPEKRIDRICFVPRGDRMVVMAFGAITVWDLGSWRATVPGTIEGGAYDIDVSGDGRWLAAAGGDGMVSVWDLATGAARTLLGVVATTEEDNEPDLGPPFDPDSYRPGERVVMGMAHARFSPDGAFVVGLHTRGKLCVWAVETGLPLLCLDAPRGRRLGLETAADRFRVIVWGESRSTGRPVIHDFPREKHRGPDLQRIIAGQGSPSDAP